MVTKVYGISGYTTTIIRIPAGDGKAWLECEFTRGCPNSAAFRPATYVTSDKTAQSIIEHSPYFGRLIKLIRVSSDEKGDAAPAKAQATARVQQPAISQEKPSQPKDESTDEKELLPQGDNEAPTEYPDVKTYEEAIAVLKSLGAKATQMRTIPMTKKLVEKMNISFPNYNFE